VTVPRFGQLISVVAKKQVSSDAGSVRPWRTNQLTLARIHACTSLLVCLACLTCGCQPLRDQPPSKEASLDLRLRVEPDGDNIRVMSNRQAPILAQTTGGILHIEDGNSLPRELRLTREQLQNGSVIYTHGSGKLHFRLDVLVGESVSAFTGNRSATTANKDQYTRTQTGGQRQEPVPSSPAAQPSTLAHKGEIPDRGVEAPQTAMRERSGQASGRDTASGETGIASFYYPESNGNELTAAYSKLPLGTRVRVTNLTNGRSVIVRIINRGPTVNRARVINVSYRAAEELGFAQAGTARVRVAPE
jgi:hypothetical protein